MKIKMHLWKTIMMIGCSIFLFGCKADSTANDIANLTANDNGSISSNDDTAINEGNEESSLSENSTNTTTGINETSSTDNNADSYVRHNGLLPEERSSIDLGKLSSDHEFYNEVINIDPDCVDYIQELTIYDAEIDDTFVVHISLPPSYDETKSYPLVVMTDGIWRLSDHPELRPLMENGEIEDVILVSIGYPNGYDYWTIRERDLVNHPDDFLYFIVDNLIPYLSETFSVSSENTTLTGHSLGGYFAFYALFYNDTIGLNTFENFYIGSPSPQAHTDGLFARNHEERYYAESQSLPANVYITVGGDENHSFVDSIEQFVQQIQDRNYEGLHLTYEVIEGYSHETVFKPSIRNTMLMFYGTEP